MTHAITTRPGALLAPQLDYFLIDGSGSMSSNWMKLHGALDGFMSTMLAQNAQSHGIVSVFSGPHDLAMIQRDSVIADWPRFSDETLHTSFGSTPLYSAVNLMGRHLKELDPPRASIVIATDGDANALDTTTHEMARAILAWCRAKGWQVTFLGVDFDNDAQAKLLGATPRNTLAIQSAHLADAGKTLGEKRLRNYRDPDTDIAFTDEEKTKFGGFLTGPSK